MYPLKSSNLYNFREGCQKERERQQGGAFSAGGTNRQNYTTGAGSRGAGGAGGVKLLKYCLRNI